MNRPHARRGHRAPHGPAGGASQSAHKSHHSLRRKPRSCRDHHRHRRARGPAEPGHHQSALPEQGRLLTETLRHLADEYRAACQAGRRVRRASHRPGLTAMVDLDFSARSAIAESSPSGSRSGGNGDFARRIDASARARQVPTTTWCADPVRTVRGRRYPGRGFDRRRRRPVGPDGWPVAGPAGAPDTMSREQARRIAMSFLADAFPRHSRPPAQGRRRYRMEIALDDKALALARTAPGDSPTRNSCPGSSRPSSTRDACRRGEGAPQAARHRARLQRHGRAGRTRRARRAAWTRSPSGNSSAGSPTPCAGVSPSRTAGCSRPAARSSCSSTSCRS